ncbi:MAG: hypothetical protein WD873_09065 [Candidatus Hydrogenedentales bacterium]
MKLRASLLILVCFVSAAPAFAQVPQRRPNPKGELHWGLMASFSPWTANDRFKVLYDARKLDFTGQEVRMGVTKGGALRGEFALLYVRKRIDEGSTLTDIRRRDFAIGPNTYVTGLMAEQFAPFGSITRYVQVGMVMAAGAGFASGTAYGLTEGTTLEAKQVLRVFARPRRFQPLARAELAVAVNAAPGMKIRFSGGFNWPGNSQLGVTTMYFFGDK